MIQNSYLRHNFFIESLDKFANQDPHLQTLNNLTYQFSPKWWLDISLNEGGIYILSGGRQIGKSTSCKLLIKHCLETHALPKKNVFYLPCDEIFTAAQLSQVLRNYLNQLDSDNYLLIIDEVTYVPDWDRVIKALADEGHFTHGICILTGSDTLILKEAAVRFPGRRGNADQVDFHIFPLSFKEYVDLVCEDTAQIDSNLKTHFNNYLITGGYLRAINDFASQKEISIATYTTYEQWLRGDFLKHKKSEETLLAILQALVTVGVSQISYSTLTQKIGLISKETCMDYCRLLERMDILMNLQAYDQNKNQGHPKKDRKFHFTDPFIYHVIHRWLQRELNFKQEINMNTIVEATVASHCARFGKTFYFKGQGEIDLICIQNDTITALEVKWAEQLRPNDLKQLKNFHNGLILTKHAQKGKIENIVSLPVYEFLYHSL